MGSIIIPATDLSIKSRASKLLKGRWNTSGRSGLKAAFLSSFAETLKDP